jgi:hypothetical protein
MAGCGHVPAAPSQLASLSFDRQVDHAERGQLEVSLNATPQGRTLLATVADVSLYRITLTGNGLSSPIMQTAPAPAGSNGKVSTIFDDLVPGVYTVTVEALDAAGHVIGTTTETVTVVRGKCTVVSLHLKLDPTYVDNRNGSVQVLIDVEDGDIIERPIEPCTPVGGYTPLVPCTPTPIPSSQPTTSPNSERVQLQVDWLWADKQSNLIWAIDVGSSAIAFDPATGTIVHQLLPTVGRINMMAPSALGGVWMRQLGSGLFYRALADGTVLGPYTLPNENELVMTTDSFGNMWLVRPIASEVVKVAPDGTVIGSYPVPSVPRTATGGINGDIYVSCDDGMIRHYGANGSLLNTIPAGGTPGNLQVDLQGNLFATLQNQRTVAKFAPNGAPVATITGFSGYPARFTVDSNNTVWVMAVGISSDLTTRTELHSIAAGTTTPVPTGIGGWGIAADSANHIWVAEDFDWAIKYTP